MLKLNQYIWLLCATHCHMSVNNNPMLFHNPLRCVGGGEGVNRIEHKSIDKPINQLTYQPIKKRHAICFLLLCLGDIINHDVDFL